jgi:outer membrane receptor protein involved in Fe transport
MNHLSRLAGITLCAALGAGAPRVGAAAAAAAAPPARDPAVMLSIFEVTGTRDEGYRSTQTVSGSRTLENLRDVPNSISILNRELIDDLNATTVSELSAFAITGEIGDNTESTIASYVFRGIVSNSPLRNGIIWLSPMDTFSVERVELLRGPSAFLYGEGTAGGSMNQLTKQALPYNFQKAAFTFGSNRLMRGEVDVNRKLGDQLALRLSLAYQASDSFVNHTSRAFKGAYLAAAYTPFKSTSISLNLETGIINEVRADTILVDAFSTTQRTGAATPYTATMGGFTFVAATGKTFSTVGNRRSSGTNIIVTNENILPRALNFFGPNAYHDVDYHAVNVNLVQKIGDNLTLQASFAKQMIIRKTLTNAGASSAGIYQDLVSTLPDGTANPYFNQFYTEYYVRRRWLEEPINDARVTAVYDLRLPFTTQRIVASGTFHDDTPEGYWNSEFVDPASPLFSGTLIDASTLAAYTQNVATLGRNFFYRRFYLKDGDGAKFTDNQPIPGRSVLRRDPVAEGAAGRLTHREFQTPSYGIGASGSFWKGRIRSLVGWRHDAFVQEPRRIFYNPVAGQEYKVEGASPVIDTDIGRESVNYGGVVHINANVSAYVNYAESVGLSSGVGGNGLVPGTVRGPAAGDGYEYGLRWAFWGGRLETNWTYYITNVLNQTASPGIPTAVRTELAALFSDLNQSGADTQATSAKGVELETVANLTPNWRLTWNFSTNKLATADRYPALNAYRSRAKAQNQATPETDSFLSTVPEGTPVPGFTKVRSNLITNYRFSTGPLKGVSVGGGFQYRDQAYRGNFDLDRNGTAEKLWSPGYVLTNLMFGYRTRLRDRPVSFTLNVNNLLDRDYYRSFGLAAGAWGAGRSFRLAIRTEL